MEEVIYALIESAVSKASLEGMKYPVNVHLPEVEKILLVKVC